VDEVGRVRAIEAAIWRGLTKTLIKKLTERFIQFGRKVGPKIVTEAD
jgi:hypothetical protein